MHEKITDLAARHSETIPWLGPIIDQVRNNEYAPNGKHPGTQTSHDLRRELLIRSRYARNMQIFGIEELISNLATRSPQDIIKNVGFSNPKKHRYFIIYFDDEYRFVGAILIKHGMYRRFLKRIRDQVDRIRLGIKSVSP